MPRRDRCLLRERWRTDLERGLAAPKPLRSRSRLWLDRILQRGRTRRAEFCRGDDVGDPPAKPSDQRFINTEFAPQLYRAFRSEITPLVHCGRIRYRACVV